MLLAFGGMAAAAVIILIPWRAGPPVFELVALSGGGDFAPTPIVPAESTDRDGASPDAIARVPLVLGVRNTGGRAARPGRLELNLPVRARLVDGDGKPLSAGLREGDPLIRYRLVGPFTDVEPGREPAKLPGMDTLWLEIIAPELYCVAVTDSVPEFLPAPEPNYEALREIRIFYSFEGGDLEQRQTGLLDVTIDADLGADREPPTIRVSPAELQRPEARLPPLEGLTYAGHRQEFCGVPEEPLELYTSVWEAANGARLFVVYYGGTPRKYLFDLSRNGYVDLEIWDASGDGRFDARRTTRYPVPPFLEPLPGPPPFDASVLDRISEDSLARLHPYYRSAFAPAYRARGARPDTAPRVNRFRPMTIERSAAETRTRRPPPAPRPPVAWEPPRPLLGEPQQRTAPGDAAPPRTPPAETPPPTPPERQPPQAQPERRPSPADTLPPPRRPLLGRPVDSIPPGS